MRIKYEIKMTNYLNQSKLTNRSIQFAKATSGNLFIADDSLSANVNSLNTDPDNMRIYPIWSDGATTDGNGTLVIDAGSDNNKIKLRGELLGLDLANIKSADDVAVFAGTDGSGKLTLCAATGITLIGGAQNVSVCSATNFTAGTASTSTTTGTVIVTGGVGISDDV